MQFLYNLGNNEGLPIKGKISRWRHLETILSQLLLASLLFFLIFQNGSLRKSLHQKLSHELLEDIIHNEVTTLSKQIEGLKATLLQAHRQHIQHTQELKAIIRIMGREMGLPLPLPSAAHQPTQQMLKPGQSGQHDREEEESENQDSEEVEENSEQGEENSFEATRPRSQPQKILQKKEDTTEEEEGVVEEDNQEEHHQESDNNSFEQEFEETVPHSRQSNSDHMEPLSEGTEDEQTGTWSKVSEEKGKANGFRAKEVHLDGYAQEAKGFLALLGHLVLILLVFGCLAMLVTLVKNPELQQKPREPFEGVLRMGCENDKGLEMTRREKVKLG